MKKGSVVRQIIRLIYLIFLGAKIAFLHENCIETLVRSLKNYFYKFFWNQYCLGEGGIVRRCKAEKARM